VEGNAESLAMFEDASFDSYTIAFGIRNVTDRDLALREAYRILKPGGRRVVDGLWTSAQSHSFPPGLFRYSDTICLEIHTWLKD